jgi:3-dehydroquinate synthase
VVSKDEREGGLRQILNFGHTLGHALEAATGYRVFLHGEAIAWGMIAAAMMALSLDRLPLVDAFRIVRLVASVGPLPKIPAIPAAKLRSILAGDKKSRGGRVLWVFPRKIGKTEWGIEVPSRLVEATVRSLPEIMNEARNGAGFAGSRRRKS